MTGISTTGDDFLAKLRAVEAKQDALARKRGQEMTALAVQRARVLRTEVRKRSVGCQSSTHYKNAAGLCSCGILSVAEQLGVTHVAVRKSLARLG